MAYVYVYTVDVCVVSSVYGLFEYVKYAWLVFATLPASAFSFSFAL